MKARDKAISAQWHRRIARARYDADLTERRYEEEADPSDRLVASALEKSRNDAMHRVIELDAEIATFERQAMRSQFYSSAKTFLDSGRHQPPQLATASKMLRLLIRDITVVKDAESKPLHLQIRWRGGATETIDVRRRPNHAEAPRYPDFSVAKIRTMAKKYDDEEIVFDDSLATA